MDDTDITKQQLSKQQTDLITKPTVTEGWHATSEITLKTLFGGNLENPVFSVPDIKNAKMFEPLAVIGQVKVNGIKYRKYLGKLSDLVNGNFLSEEVKGLLERPKLERVEKGEISDYRGRWKCSR